MICVWGVYADMLTPARALCEQRGLRLSEDEVMGLGELWQSLWRLDPDRRPKKCPLCEEPKPAGNTQLFCSCILAKSVGQYIDYHVPGNIAAIAARNPGNWRSLTAEAYACSTCDKICEVSLGQVADIFNRGRSWRTPSYCRKCSHEYFNKQKETKDTPPNVDQEPEQFIGPPAPDVTSET